MESGGENTREENVTFRYPSPARRDSHLRRVSFPENDTDLVTGYMEPINPLRLARNVTNEEILKAYLISCQRHETVPIKSVTEQIEGLNFNNYRCGSFDLNEECSSYFACESLEEIFKRVQFIYINLVSSALSEETAVALFDMFEYYESATHLKLSLTCNIGLRGWQACALYLKNSTVLEQFEAYNTQMDETEAEYLLRPLAWNHHLLVLKLEKCNLSGKGVYTLVKALNDNNSLQELYLSDNDLGVSEAALIGNLLKHNTAIQVLDLSNNSIEDLGFQHIVIGLCDQKDTGKGLAVFVLWNNLLSSNSTSYFSKLFQEYKKLEVLNVGCNHLGDDIIDGIKESLGRNNTLLRLGLQSCDLSNIAVANFGDILKENITLERIDFRGNKITQDGLKYLTANLDINKSILQVDLDDVPFDSFQLGAYMDLLKEIQKKCQANKTRKSNELAKAEVKIVPPRIASRKISLTCQTLMQSCSTSTSSSLLTEPRKCSGRLRSPDPSPVPSPASSPIPVLKKNRFSVSRVSEGVTSVLLSTSKLTAFTITRIATPYANPSYNSALSAAFNFAMASSSTQSTSSASVPVCTAGGQSQHVYHSSPSSAKGNSSISNETIDSDGSYSSDDNCSRSLNSEVSSPKSEK